MADELAGNPCDSAFFDSAYRASACAGTAVDALSGIDFEFAIAHADSANGASTFTSTAADASIFNNVCHYDFLLNENWVNMYFNIKFMITQELFEQSHFLSAGTHAVENDFL